MSVARFFPNSNTPRPTVLLLSCRRATRAQIHSCSNPLVLVLVLVLVPRLVLMLGVRRHRITTRADPLAVAPFIGADWPAGWLVKCDLITVVAERIPPQRRLAHVAAARLGLAAAHLVGQPGSRRKDRPIELPQIGAHPADPLRRTRLVAVLPCTAERELG